MIRRTGMLICLIIIFTICLASCGEKNAAGSENVVQHDQEYGEDAIPPQLFHMDKVGLYLYYEIGSRMHFCIIPVDQQNLSEFQKAGAKIEKIHL